MKAILISVHPQWAKLILSYIKKDEIRKGTAIGKAINRLIKEQGVAPMFIYCTKEKKTNKWAKRNVLCSDVHNGKPSGHYQLWLKDIDDGLHTILNGKVVARFNATVEEINAINLDKFAKDSCLTIRELEEYLWSNILSGTAIHINDLKPFDKPKELKEFKHLVRYRSCKKCPYYGNPRACEKLPYCCEYEKIYKAPQSWCYVEVEDENFN